MNFKNNQDIILKLENVSKQYRLGVIGTGTISHDLNRWWHKVRGKEDPFLKIGESNDRATKGESDYVWALKDINIEVERGEVLGIIGKNGAGKSTLLKILSRVTGPTTGSIKSAGRMASLLEVGTGFHPELTGKENVFLNGAILGMTKTEIEGKLDEIVEFSGCERYVDTPVKRYSSGMRVRLAFAVAAFLEPDILVVDEVLAVGDAEFQKKAIGKMKDISSGQGRTVLFVSHNMSSISTLCTRCLVLENGQVSYVGETDDAIEFYLKGTSHQQPVLNLAEVADKLNRTGPREFYELQKIELLNHIKNPKTELLFGKEITVKVKFEAKEDVKKTEIGIGVINGMGILLGGHVSNWNGLKQDFKKGVHEVEMTLPFLYVAPGQYHLSIWIKEQGKLVDDQVANVIEFSVEDSHLNGNKTNLGNYKHLNLTLPSTWKEII